jgi:hypothetical protein
MTALGRFISRLGERALPFFKIMKRSCTFKWTPEVVAAFEDLKRYLTSPPILVAPCSHEPLLLYLVETPQTAIAVLMAEREEPIPVKETAALLSPKPPDEEEASSTPSKATHQTCLIEENTLTELPEKKNLGELPASLHEDPAPPPKARYHVQRPVYFISTMLRDAREHYTMQQKLLYVLLIASRKSCHYF